MLRAMPSTVDRVTRPEAAASASAAVKNLPPGISRSSPAFAESTVDQVEPQSDTTKPSKPNWCRSTSVSKAWF